MNKTASILLLLSLSLVSCAYRTDITRDDCFQGLADKKLVTKNDGGKLRLYGNSYAEREEDILYDLTTVDKGEHNLIGFVPPGSPVTIQKIYAHHDIGITSKHVLGKIDYRGKTYPFSFYLGTHVYPDSWRWIFESFEPLD